MEVENVCMSPRTCVSVHVELELRLLLERGPALVAGERLVSGVSPPDVAVVRRVGGEGLPAVFALERPLAGVLADVCAQNTGGGEGLRMMRRSYQAICGGKIKL